MELSRIGCHSSTNFEPIHIRFTNYPPYERLRIAINTQYPCIIQLDSLARASFALHEKLESHHLLLEEATAHFTQPFVFIQCFMSLPASHARIEPGNLPFLPRSLQVRLTSFILLTRVMCTYINSFSAFPFAPCFPRPRYSISVGASHLPISSDHTTRFQYETTLPQIHPLHD